MLSWRTRSKEQGALVLGFAIVVLAALLCTGFDAIYDRLATVRHVEQVEGGRLQMLRDMSAEFKLFPLVGTGLGTHEYVFPMFDHSSIREVATHAEDEFAQLLEEAGVLGLLLAIAFLSLIASSFWRCIRNPVKPAQYAAFGLGFGLIAILIHSFSDFGQHVPANAVLTACSAGLLINIARLSPRVRTSTDTTKTHALITPGLWRYQAILRLGLALFFLTTGAWCVASTEAARVAENAWDTALESASQLRNAGWQGSDDQYVSLLQPATSATQSQPENIKYRYGLNLYRWRSLSRTSTPGGQTFELRRAALPFVARIVNDLDDAAALCPTYGPTYSLAGDLQYFVLGNKKGIAQINTGFRLNPIDPVAGFIVAHLALQDHRWNDAVAAFESACKVGADKREAMALCVNEADRPDLAYQLAAGDSSALRYLIELLANRPQDQALIAQCRIDTVSLLQHDADQPSSSADMIADLAAQYAILNDKPKAITYYRKALALDYSRVDWHFQLANLLAESGDTQGGMSEARVCLRIRPQMKEAETLLGNLSIQPPARLGT